MADLSAMYMDLAESTRNSTQRGILGMQQMMENQLSYQKAREDLEAQRGLRALFAQNPNASSEEVSRYSPQFGMEMNKYALDQQERSGRMRKTQREISEMEAKAVAETLGPIAERAKVTGDLNQYKIDIGRAASALAQQGIPLPMNFDPETHTPDAVLMNSVGRGYKSPWLESQYAVQQKQTPSASDKFFIGPDGLPHPNPLVQQGGGGQQPDMQSKIQPYPVFEFDGKTYKGPEFMRMAIREKDPAKKQRMEEMLYAGIQQQQEGTLTDPNAVEMPKTKQQLEVEAAREKKQAELEVEGAHEAEQQLTTLKALDEQNVESLIDKSFHSKPEAFAKGEYGLSGMAGMPTEANTAYKELVVIEAQMRDMAKAIVGAGPISEGEQKIIKDALGGVSTPGDATSRKSAYRQFVKLAKTKISKYPYLAQQIKAIDEMSSEQNTTPSADSSGKSLKIGDIHKGMEYQGGNPNDKSNWKKVQ
jgi:hypothetical protein